MIFLQTLNISLCLAMVRLIISFFVMPFLVYYLLPFNIIWINALVGLFFVLMCMTDFLDGYCARMNHHVTHVGKILDPIINKFLVYSTLVSLLAINKIYFYWVVLLLGRDFFVSGLRLIALENLFEVTASFLGKIKTIFQMMMLTFIIVNPYQNVAVDQALIWYKIEWFLLSSAIVLSLLSAALYVHVFAKEWNRRAKELGCTAK